MANLQDIRSKINSTKKTQQTTKAVKMVSAAKLRRAQERIVNARPYAYRIRDVINKLSKSNTLEHPLLGHPEEHGKVLLVVITSDRGLCGAFNGSINKYARQFYERELANHSKIDFLFIGKKGFDYFKKYNVNSVEVILNLANDISYKMAAEVSEKLLQYYMQGEYTEIRLIYNQFQSAISQVVTDEVLVPIRHEETPENDNLDFIFEPPAVEILDLLLTKHFAVQVFKSLQESVASEHGSRMSAMENATRNAGEMIKQMTLKYNKIRQAAITTELIEITSGAEALKG
ncbi:MAG: ATP synthase F1 subunit gamma [Bdellovibrionota bacterium]